MSQHHSRRDWLIKLVHSGLISEDTKTELIKVLKPSESIFEYLFKICKVDEKDLVRFLAKESDTTIVHLGEYDISEEVLAMIPPDMAKRYQALPLSLHEKVLTIAAAEPLNPIALDDLQRLTGCEINLTLAEPSQLQLALKSTYLFSNDDEEETQEDESESIQEIVDSLEKNAFSIEPMKSKAFDLHKGAEGTPVINIVNLLILEALMRGASDLFLEPWEKQMRVRCRRDGLLEEIKCLPAGLASEISSRVKVMSNLDIAERRIPQDGRFKARIKNKEIDFRVSILPIQFGEKVCIRILDKGAQAQDLESLGFESTQLAKITHAALKPHGMILVTGPTGSGKTTTLYSVLNLLHDPEKNITTVEDPVEYQIKGINQVNANDAVGLTFSGALRSILRQDPDIIMIGEIRDQTTMDTAIKAALTGHLVLSTLHTNDAAGSIVRIINMGVEPFLLASSVNLITAQRLLRKLCLSCREPYSPDPDLIKLIDNPMLHKGLTLYRQKGCRSCRQTGYAGRCVITEVLEFTEAMKVCILEDAAQDKIRQTARKEGMISLRESGLIRVIAGFTTLEEVMRVTAVDVEKSDVD